MNWQLIISVQVDLGFNMNILDIGGGFTGSEFQLKQVRSKSLWKDLKILSLDFSASFIIENLVAQSGCLTTPFLLAVSLRAQVESAVRPLLDTYFSPLSGVQVLAQPGSFYVASAFSLAVSVIGKKMVNHRWDSLAPGEHLKPLSFP